MTTPAQARVAARRLHTQAYGSGNRGDCDANLAEVMEAIEAWEKATIPTPDGWRTARDYDCSYAEGYDHASGAWCRKLSGEKREWYVGANPKEDGELREFRSADEARAAAIAMVPR